jgi:hypothetical protein
VFLILPTAQATSRDTEAQCHACIGATCLSCVAECEAEPGFLSDACFECLIDSCPECYEDCDDLVVAMTTEGEPTTWVD